MVCLSARSPESPGHEGWGRIDALGREVCGLTVGERVAGLSSHAYAPYDIAPADTVVPLPASLDGMPFPGEALGRAMNIVRRSAIHSGQTVAIIGIGFLGALLTSLVDAGRGPGDCHFPTCLCPGGRPTLWGNCHGATG